MVSCYKLAQKLSTLKATLFRGHLTKEYSSINWKAMYIAICLEHKDQMQHSTVKYNPRWHGITPDILRITTIFFVGVKLGYYFCDSKFKPGFGDRFSVVCWGMRGGGRWVLEACCEETS